MKLNLDKIINKIESSISYENLEKVAEKAADKVTTLVGKPIGMQTEDQLLSEIPYNYKLILKQLQSDSPVFEGVFERDSYRAYDENNHTKYRIQGSMLMGKHHFSVKNETKEEVGKVNKRVINVPLPFIKEDRSCTLEIDGEEFCTMDTCIEFGERCYHIRHEYIKIQHNQYETEFKIYNSLIAKNDPIACIYKASDCAFGDKYVIGYQHQGTELLVLLIAIGLDTIRFS